MNLWFGGEEQGELVQRDQSAIVPGDRSGLMGETCSQILQNMQQCRS